MDGKKDEEISNQTTQEGGGGELRKLVVNGSASGADAVRRRLSRSGASPGVFFEAWGSGVRG